MSGGPSVSEWAKEKRKRYSKARRHAVQQLIAENDDRFAWLLDRALSEFEYYDVPNMKEKE